VSDIFREIDEELRRDNLLKLWSRYGRYVVAFVVIVLVVAGGIVAWRDHQLSERRLQSQRYASALALAREGKEAEAAKVFAAIAQESGGYAVLASFEEAELVAKSGDRKGAVAAYDRIAAKGGLDPAFRGLAVLLSVMHGMPEADLRSISSRQETKAARSICTRALPTISRRRKACVPVPPRWPQRSPRSASRPADVPRPSPPGASQMGHPTGTRAPNGASGARG
jgi:hypothetical protein